MLTPTPEGERLVADAQDAGRRRPRAALASWSADDVAVLADSLGRLNKAIDEVTGRS